MGAESGIAIEPYCMAPLYERASHGRLEKACTPLAAAVPGDILALGWTLNLVENDGVLDFTQAAINDFLVVEKDGRVGPAYFGELSDQHQPAAAMALATLQGEELHWDQFRPILHAAWKHGRQPAWARLWMAPDFIVVCGEMDIAWGKETDSHVVIEASEKMTPFLLLEWPQSQHQALAALAAARQGCALLERMWDTPKGPYRVASPESIIEASRF